MENGYIWQSLFAMLTEQNQLYIAAYLMWWVASSFDEQFSILNEQF
ncbi:hypothetical protein [Virgibacillus sp. YIM 98842]|nr:hypothetical protein [Virgibacillus sp. YIM 98842]